MYYKNSIKSTASKLLILYFGFITLTQATQTQQLCDGEKKTCCLAESMASVPPMWVSADTCPKGTIDDPNCVPQFGCKKI